MSIWTLEKEMSIAVSHRLHGLPPDHKCGRLHGHNLTVRVEIRASALLHAPGMAVDFGVVKAVVARFDHRDLNEELKKIGVNESPTMEVFSRVLWGLLDDAMSEIPGRPSVHEVSIRETDSSMVRYRPFR